MDYMVNLWEYYDRTGVTASNFQILPFGVL